MTDHTEGLPQALIDLIGNYGAARKNDSDIEAMHRWQLLLDGVKAYGEACAKAARAEAESWEKQASDRVDDALRFAREADEWKAKALAARSTALEEAAKLVEDYYTHGDHTQGWQDRFAECIRALSSKEAEHAR